MEQNRSWSLHGSSGLPESILQTIFAHLDSASLVTCLRISHLFYDLVSDILYSDLTLDTESIPGLFVGAAAITGAGSVDCPLRNTKCGLLAKVRSITLTTHPSELCESYIWATRYLFNVRELWVVREEISRYELKELCGSTTPCPFFHSLAAIATTIGFANIFGDEGMGVNRRLFTKCTIAEMEGDERVIKLPSHEQFLLPPHVAFQIPPTPDSLDNKIVIPSDRAGFREGDGGGHGGVPQPAQRQGTRQGIDQPMDGIEGQEDEGDVVARNYHTKADLSVLLRRFPPLSPQTLILHFLPDGRSIKSARLFVHQLVELFESPTPHIPIIKVLFTPMEKVRGMVQHPSSCTCIACRYALPVAPKGDVILMLRVLRLVGKKVEVYGMEDLAVALHPMDKRSHRYLWGLKRKEDEERRQAVLDEIRTAVKEDRRGKGQPPWVSGEEGVWRSGLHSFFADTSANALHRAWKGSDDGGEGDVVFLRAEEYRSSRQREVGHSW